MITDNITPKLRKRFLQEIKKTKETNTERGFYLCIEENGKLSAGNTCTGDECSVKFQHINILCAGKKAQGDFHTHTYLADVRKKFGIEFKGASDKLIRSAVNEFLKESGRSPTIPSYRDAKNAILGKCAKKTNGTTCIGSDLDENNMECWTAEHMDDGDCIRVLMEEISPEEIGSILPKDWILPIFEKEIITLK